MPLRRPCSDMGGIWDLGPLTPEPDLEAMDRQALADYLETVRAWIARLDLEEPADMDSEAYDEWGDRHEILEDLADDVLDRLDELKDEK